MKYFTGVGSRETPKDIQELMTTIAAKLELEGWVLRSGAAEGADAAFEKGIKNTNNAEIYLPWQKFNKHPSPLYYVCDDALEMASKIHPAWNKCSDQAKYLHARNCYQVLGKNLDNPSKMLICFTEGGEEKGGTRTAIVLAKQHNVPVFNLGDEATHKRIRGWINR